ncbi:SGNH/GDSL hydrolase family protein [Streptomyces alanosinicus]|uniref:Lipase 1 n=1 Tax=Streptomyces alanosinicus TaxID=68171 RepID=A0A918MIH7_9ACTN|nr:SGNH/GDSL hydrolase family protein [Streptomyces alanosinicus]GGW25085.1 lipase 1 [Streptomyces alanosinicus]
MVYALSLGLAQAVTPAHARPGQPDHVHLRYTALGDSVATGAGAGPVSGDCYRSPGAYPVLWAAAHHPEQFVFAACAGATISDVITKQLSGITGHTTLVSITAGANDVGFDATKECVLADENTCLEGIARAEQTMDKNLPGKFGQLYRAVEARTARGARVVVLGYPRLYADRACPTGLLTQRELSALNAAMDHLDQVIESGTRTHPDVTFADVRPSFTGHGICSGHPWINSPPALTAYHPNAQGQRQGYLPALTATTDHRP